VSGIGVGQALGGLVQPLGRGETLPADATWRRRTPLPARESTPLQHHRHSMQAAGILPLSLGRQLHASVSRTSSSSVPIRRCASAACRFPSRASLHCSCVRTYHEISLTHFFRIPCALSARFLGPFGEKSCSAQIGMGPAAVLLPMPDAIFAGSAGMKH